MVRDVTARGGRDPDDEHAGVNFPSEACTVVGVDEELAGTLRRARSVSPDRE